MKSIIKVFLERIKELDRIRDNVSTPTERDYWQGRSVQVTLDMNTVKEHLNEINQSNG
jgi:hypothetical protein